MMRNIRQNSKLIQMLSILFLLALISLVSVHFFLQETQNKQHTVFLNQTIDWIEKNYGLQKVSHWEKPVFTEIIDHIEEEQHINFFDPVGDPLDGSKATLTPTIASIIQSNHNQASNIDKTNKQLYVARAIRNKNGRIGIIQLTEPLGRFSQSFQTIQIVILSIFSLLFLILALMIWFMHRRAEQPIKYALPVIEEMIDHPENQQKLHLATSDWSLLYEKLNILMKQTNNLYFQQLFNEEKLDYILDQLEIGILIFNNESNEKKLNQVAKDLYYKANGFKQQLEQLFSQLQNEKQMTLRREIQLEFPDTKILNVVIQVNHYQNTKEIENIVIIYDITTIKTIERAHKDFIRNVSHELKTPTTAIVGFTETLIDNPTIDPATQQQFIGIIDKEGRRLQKLIQNVLILMKTDVKQTDELLEKVSSTQLIQEEIAHYQPRLTQKQLTIKSSLLGFADYPEIYFQPIIKNLLENAIEYSPIKGTIEIDTIKDGTFFVLTIRDEGIGIPKEEHARIFETFYRVSESRQRGSGGTGLGLSIVKNAVQQLNGTIELTSSPNQGTCFKLRFPI